MANPFAENSYKLQTIAHGIEYELIAPSDGVGLVEGKFGGEGHAIQVKCRVRFAEMFTWLSEMLGTSDELTGGGGRLTRSIPERFRWRDDGHSTRIPVPYVDMYAVDCQLMGVYGNGVPLDDANYLKAFKDQPQPYKPDDNMPRPLWAVFGVRFVSPNYEVYKDGADEMNGGLDSFGEWKRCVVEQEQPFAENEVVGLGATMYKVPIDPRESYLIGRARYSQIPRGRIIGDSDGFLKLLFRRDDRKLLGVHVIGEQASEVVHVGLLALTAGLGATAFTRTCFNYPTLGELYQLATYDALSRG